MQMIGIIVTGSYCEPEILDLSRNIFLKGYIAKSSKHR